MMKYLRIWFGGDTTRGDDVRRVAERALKTYEKTFKDLARYDRGELDARPISR